MSLEKPEAEAIGRGCKLSEPPGTSEHTGTPDHTERTARAQAGSRILTPHLHKWICGGGVLKIAVLR